MDQATDEVRRLRARVAELEDALKPLVNSQALNQGLVTVPMRDAIRAAEVLSRKEQ